MNKKILFIITSGFLGFLSWGQTFTWNPEFFNSNESAVLTVSDFDPQSEWSVSDIYLWSWHFQEDGTQINNPTATGNNFGNSPETAKFVDNGDGTYSYDFGVIEDFFDDSDVDRIGFLLKSQDGSSQTIDFFKQVGVFQLTLTSPTENPTIVSAGDMVSIIATASESANFELTANGNMIDSQNERTNYSYDATVNETTDFVLTATEVGTNTELSESFTVIVSPEPNLLPVPNDAMDGANLDFPSNGDITFVLFGEGKEFVYLIGSFNNWAIDDNFVMNYDASTGKHWITVSGLANEDTVLYQYLVEATITVADPYSTLILDQFNDPFIDSDTFANIPDYPLGETDNPVSWLRPNQAEYNWQVNNFTPVAKEDLVIYELLLRDFDDDHHFDDVVARLDYLEDLGVNAIELMPVNEFDGNLSWGYNPAFHMALDKYYGSPEDFKAMIDACHARGIAVLVDVVYNQGTGQHPFYRMWNTDGGGTGGQASNDSPFFNPNALHSFSVFNDFNHQSEHTQEYVKETLKFWLNEFRLDGFRFDLTKGFTQNCPGGANQDFCTNSFNQDRVDVLKEYADACWAANDNALVIFEHLGSGGSRNEEIEWSNYRLNEGKGIMFWNKFTDPYNESTMGYHDGGKSNFNGMAWNNIGLSAPMNIGYMESHDEERLMYKNLAFGNSSGGYEVTDTDTALDRMKAAGAFFFTIPGPKMIWQFGELGYDISIFECEDGTIPQPYGNDACRTGNKPDGWDYLGESNRTDVYDTWETIIDFKENLPIFKTSDFTIDSGRSDGLKRIELNDSNASGNEIGHVIIIGNFGVTQQSINPNFPETGTWFNMLTGQEFEVNNTTTPISLDPGEFLMYSDQSTLSTGEFDLMEDLVLYPNPAKRSFSLNQMVDSITIFDITGKIVFDQKSTIDAGNPINIDLSQGMYFIRTQRDTFEQTIKLLVD